MAKVRAKVEEAVASSASSFVRGAQEALLPAEFTAAEAAPPLKEKRSHRSLLRKMVGGLSSDESVEWVSSDAARVERGESV